MQQKQFAKGLNQALVLLLLISLIPFNAFAITLTQLQSNIQGIINGSNSRFSGLC